MGANKDIRSGNTGDKKRSESTNCEEGFHHKEAEKGCGNASPSPAKLPPDPQKPEGGPADGAD